MAHEPRDPDASGSTGSPGSPGSIEALTVELLEHAQAATAAERLCALVAGALRFALRSPDAARRLLLRREAEQIADDAFADAQTAGRRKRRVCLGCGRLFAGAGASTVYKGGWCDEACFTRWSADLPPEPPRRS